MTTTVKIAPVQKTVHVAASQVHASEVFTSGLACWWPKGHSIAKTPMKAMMLEPRLGGRWFVGLRLVAESRSSCGCRETGRSRQVSRSTADYRGRRIDLDQCAIPNFRSPLSQMFVESRMSLSAEGYVGRAEECVRLANLTADQIVQADILKLRQNYLQTAERLGSSKGAPQSGPTGHDRK